MILTCDTCGKTTDEITTHHVLPRGLGGTDLPSNMVEICVDCHNLIHNRENGYSSNLIKLGLKKAKDRGQKLGPPIKITDHIYTKCIALRKGGASYIEISQILGISNATAHKIIMENKAKEKNDR
jgi:hypothetical protein